MINGISGVLVLSFVLLPLVWSSVVPSSTSEPSNLAKANTRNSCIQNCANCVRFWEHGLYNGERCANKCKRKRGRVVVDPDCNNPKMFNIEMLIEIQRTQPQPEAEETMQGDQPARSSDQWETKAFHRRGRGKHFRRHTHRHSVGHSNGHLDGAGHGLMNFERRRLVSFSAHPSRERLV